MYVYYELKKSVAFVQASLSYTQVFVFYFINNLCSVELVNKNITTVFFTIYKHCRQPYCILNVKHGVRSPIWLINMVFELVHSHLSETKITRVVQQNSAR